MKPRFSHGSELDAYLVFNTPIRNELVQNPILECSLEMYPENQTHTRAIRVYGDTNHQIALETLQALLRENTMRWLELGMRGYAMMEKKREYRPWRSHKHLTRDAFLALVKLEPEIRYHAPV
jgi:hypothetical protein